MQRNPPVIRNAFLGNTGNYSFGAAAAAAAAAAAITGEDPASVTSRRRFYTWKMTRQIARPRCFARSRRRVSIRSEAEYARRNTARRRRADDDETINRGRKWCMGVACVCG